MRRTDSLFQLIKALNRADKRNFKLLTQLTSGDKKYLRLFDSIDKQNEYDEGKLIRQFKGDNIVNQFSVAKNYLYNSILKSLVHFYKGDDADLNYMGMQVKVLMDKNLLPHAQKILRKAKQKAAKQEEFHELMRLYQTERDLLLGMHDFKRFGALIREIQQQELEVQGKIDNLLRFKHLTDRIFQVMTSSQSARAAGDLEAIQGILADEAMVDPDFAQSTRAQILYHNILRNHAHYRGNYDEMVGHAKAVVACFDKQPDLQDSWIHVFISALYNLSHSLYVVREIEASRAVLERMKGIRTRSEKARVSIFQWYYVMTLGHAMNAGEVEEGRSLLEALSKEMSPLKGKLTKSTELMLYFLAAKTCLVAGDFQAGVQWIQQFLNEPRTEIRTDLQCHARLIHLMLQYELGHTEMVRHELNSTYRFLYKKDRLYAVERMLLDSIKKLTAPEPSDNPRHVFRGMREAVLGLKENLYEGPALRLLSLESWIDSKLDGRSFAEVRKRYFRNSMEEGWLKDAEDENTTTSRI